MGLFMRKYFKFEARPVAQAVSVLLALAAVATASQAGPGFGDAFDLNNIPFVIQSYFASSPAGARLWTPILNTDGTPKLDAQGRPMLAPDSYDPANREAYDAKVKQFYPNGYPGTGKALRKFIDPLPLLGAANAKVMADGVTQKYIPVAKSSKWRNPQGALTGDDYYEIAAIEYADRFHTDLNKATTLRGYVQIDAEASNGRTALAGSKAVGLSYPSGAPIMINGTDANGKLTGVQVRALAFDNPHFLGPVIQSVKDTPTRVKFYNLLPVGRAATVTNPDGSVTVTQRNGDLFLPVDPSIVGAGFGPDGLTTYTQNRTNIHLHGGDSPWISDGGPHTWITPAGESDATNPAALAGTASIAPAVLGDFLRGPGALNVPDMNDPGAGAMTYYYPNGQSARMEWYHDHTVGVTRLNAYAGLLSAYFLTDPTEQALIADGTLPGADATIPLILGDRTFVPDDIAFQDGRWNTSAWGQPGDSWFPHVYETVQDPNQATNFNSVGRWHWGPWFWPSYPSLYNLPSGGYGDVTTTPEAWNDTPTVNGVAYPTMTVEPKPYRLRILNAANDRTISFNMFVADSSVITDDGRLNTEVKMVPVNTWSATACANLAATRSDGICTPASWSTDVYGHNGGVPDATTQGPRLHQIANEGGLLPGVAIKDPTPTAFLLDKGRAAVLNVDWGASGLTLGNAERADVVVDFSQYAGKTLIVYNDSGAPVPAADPRNEYFTGYGDNSATGGAEDTRPGYGPNSRTMMQIVVAPAATGTVTALNPATLDAKVKAAYLASQGAPVVAQSAYNAALGTSWTDTKAFATIFTGSVKSPTFNFVPGTPSAAFNSVLVSNGGSGYTRLPSVALTGGGGARATANASMKIERVYVVNPGSGYKTAPLIRLTSEGAGASATAMTDLSVSAVQVALGGSGYSMGSVATATISSGGLYTPGVRTISFGNAAANRYPTATQTPAVTLSGGGGTGATATAVMAGAGATRRVASITVTNPGSGYTTPPTVTIAAATGTGAISATLPVATTASIAPTVTFPAPVGGAAATATVQFNASTGVVTGLTLTNAGRGYSAAPVPSFVGGTVSTAAVASTTITAMPTVTFSAPLKVAGSASVLVTATGVPTVSATGGITGVTITNPGSGYTSAPAVTVLGTSTTRASLSSSGSVNAVMLTVPDPTNPLSAGGGGYTDLSTLASEPNNLTPGMSIYFDPPTNAGGVVATAGATGRVFDVTLSNSGSGYTSAPTVSFIKSPKEPVYSTNTATTTVNYTPFNNAVVSATAAVDTATGTGVAQGNILVKTKAIQELFDPTYGRLNATFGIEIPYTSALTQTTIPLGYVDAPTEEFADGETQIWKITHNGVDTHPVHFHLLNVQLINRVGWDNFVTPPEPNELGWKETIKMSPLEDAIVAVRAKKPALRQSSSDGSFRVGAGFGLPNSVRRLDPSQPEGAMTGFTQINTNTGLPASMANAIQDFGWEYVWHCHILGHEENDFMRPIIFHANEAIPTAATGLTAIGSGTQVALNWTDVASTEFQYRVERAAVGATAWTALATMPANSTQYTDAAAGANASYQYRVVAVGQAGQSPSNTAVVAALPNAPTSISVAQSGSNLVLTWADASTTETSWSVQRATVTAGVVGAFSNVSFALPTGTTATTGNRTATDNGVVAGSSYVYRVAAVNATGSSAYVQSAAVSVSAAVVVPGAPTTLAGSSTPTPTGTQTATTATTATVNFNWTAPTTGGAVVSYQVQRCTVVGTLCVFANVTGTFPTATSFQQTGVNRKLLGVQLTYRYRVGAVNSAGTTNSTTFFQVAP